jgi:hypothetical protein
VEYSLFLFQVGYLTTLSVSRQYGVYYRMINEYGAEGKMQETHKLEKNF